MTAPLNCIIIDDEEGAHLVLGHYLKSFSSLALRASFYNAIEAMEYIHKKPVDLIFLDINMPGVSGMDMLEALSNPPLVVLTTAYSEYALQSYKYQVVDYLVKPIDLPRFTASIDKVFKRYRPAVSTPQETDPAAAFLMLKVAGEVIKVHLHTITHVQSWGNYVKVHTTDQVHLSPLTTAEIEQKLDGRGFQRIHKSYIVGLNHIQKITPGEVQLDNGHVLPVGNTYRRDLMDHFR
ncbi:LytR/AlgR family response regulator transcription factor [Chitinophaga vietnamensis]|uniref:LytR/AlgR family response regulator transcription factor n=1 Tax=Chitinophaga vietnamensis TaxID=2593957 RepID=UPI001177439D|nr:LytTR family DNA-binding domain-containing protein [Chitinophaga vietnamensis]